MVTDLFGGILQELGRILEIADLHPDRNNSCLIKLKSGMQVQLEIDPSGRFLIVGTDLGEMPPGKYRENFFREALKANALPYPNIGIFAYSRRNNHLIFFDRLFLPEINGEKIAAFITPFSEKAALWGENLTRGDVPVASQYTTASSRSGGMFGLRP